MEKSDKKAKQLRCFRKNISNETKPTTAFLVGSVGAVRIVVALVTSINAAAISTLELLTPACRFGHWCRLRVFENDIFCLISA